MVNERLRTISRVWFRFSKTTKDGKKLQFRWEQVPEHRFEEFIEFKINYYVQQEFGHVIAGVYKNPEAIKEYRQIVSKLYKKPVYQNSICCVDDESSKMVGFNSMRLYKKGDNFSIIPPIRTTEVKSLYQSILKWSSLYPIDYVLAKYGEDKIFDDGGLALHPDIRGYKFTDKASLLRVVVCKEHDVPLIGGWMTSAATQQVIHRENWDVPYEVSQENAEKIFGIKFQNTPKLIYAVKRIE